MKGNLEGIQQERSKEKNHTETLKIDNGLMMVEFPVDDEQRKKKVNPQEGRREQPIPPVDVRPRKAPSEIDANLSRQVSIKSEAHAKEEGKIDIIEYEPYQLTRSFGYCKFLIADGLCEIFVPANREKHEEAENKKLEEKNKIQKDKLDRQQKQNATKANMANNKLFGIIGNRLRNKM